MKQLTAIQQHHLESAWAELRKAQSLAEVGRRGIAQEVLTEALFLANQLPRWFTDEQWKLQFEKLHRKLYTGI
jgi:hypothetical protein